MAADGAGGLAQQHSLGCLVGVLMVRLHEPARRIGADGQEGDFDIGAVADFFKSVKIRGVTAMQDGAAGVFDEKSAKSAVTVMKDPRAAVNALILTILP